MTVSLINGLKSLLEGAKANKISHQRDGDLRAVACDEKMIAQLMALIAEEEKK